jgi:hypothetical protein
MSSEDDNPLIRWARRKQAVRTGGDAGLGSEAPAAGPTEGATRALPAERPPEASEVSETAAEEITGPPPSLDDLTAESNLAVFFRKDVPEHLRTAALRKMWSLDPAIRDHIGLAENSWDFTQPDSIPGFGSIAEAAVPDFFSTSASDAPPVTDAPAASVRAPEIAARETRIEQAPPRVTAAPHSPPDPEAEQDEASDTAGPVIASRHGGALPRE